MPKRKINAKAVKSFPPILSGMDWLSAGSNRKRAKIHFTAFTVSVILFLVLITFKRPETPNWGKAEG